MIVRIFDGVGAFGGATREQIFDIKATVEERLSARGFMVVWSRDPRASERNDERHRSYVAGVVDEAIDASCIAK